MRLAVFALVLVSPLAHLSCDQGGFGPSGPGTSEPWTPPPKEVVDTDLDSVTVGRLWVLPSPIRVRPEWDGTTPVGETFPIVIANMGCQDVSVTGFRIEGNSDFVFSDGDPGLEIGYPVRIGGTPSCTSGSSLGFGMAYRPTSGSTDPGTLVVETSDPTSPTLRIPIAFDTAGTHTPYDPLELPPNYYESYIWSMEPNPVHISTDRPSTTEVCVSVETNGSGFAFMSMRVDGEGLSLVEPVDHYNPRISYTPTGGDVDGSLIIDFTDNWGDAHTLVVPILVR